MKWLGLNWLDIGLGIALLAFVPFLFAAYGGYLATETISDPKRRRNIKLQFWGLFVVGVILASWQQIRSAVADEERETRAEWAQALLEDSLRHVPLPSFAYTKTTIRGNAPIQDVVLRFVYPQSLAIEVENVSEAIIRDARYSPIVWNLDSGSDSPMPLPVQTLTDFLRPHEAFGPYSLTRSINQPLVPLAKAGDRILGFITVTCARCARTRAYRLYAVQGDAASSWYAELPNGQHPDTTQVFKEIADIRQNPDAFFSTIKQSDRKKPAVSPEALKPTKLR